MQIESLLQSQHHYTTATIILQVDTGIIVTKFQYLFWIFCHMATPCNSARSLRQDFCPNSKFGKRRNTVCTRKGYAASVSRLMPATAALYFPFSIPKSGRKRSAHSRRRFNQSFLFYSTVYESPVRQRGFHRLLMDDTSLGDGAQTAPSPLRESFFRTIFSP